MTEKSTFLCAARVAKARILTYNERDMIYFAFLLAAILNTAASVSTKYNTKIGGKAALFNLVRALVPLAAFALIAAVSGESLTPLTVLFGAIYGVAMTAATRTGYTALSLGPMGITGAIAQCSLVPVTLWCVLVYREPLTVPKVAGICLAVAALVVMNVEKPDRDYPHKKKWLLFSLLTLLFNAACSITITLASSYGVSGGGWFTAFSYVVATLAFGGAFAVSSVADKRKAALLSPSDIASVDGEAPETEKTDNGNAKSPNPEGEKTVKAVPKSVKTAISGGIAGFTTAASAFITFLLSGSAQGSVLFPTVAVVTLLSSFVVGTLVFREKITVKRVIAVLLAAAAVFILKFAA